MVISSCSAQAAIAIKWVYAHICKRFNSKVDVWETTQSIRNCFVSGPSGVFWNLPMHFCRQPPLCDPQVKDVFNLILEFPSNRTRLQSSDGTNHARVCFSFTNASQQRASVSSLLRYLNHSSWETDFAYVSFAISLKGKRRAHLRAGRLFCVGLLLRCAR